MGSRVQILRKFLTSVVMLKTLYGKIALILSCLFIVLALLYVLLALFTTRLYIQEGAQRLNHDLAAYLVSRMEFIQDGKINREALKESFDMLMKINHNIEVYLLDPNGEILAYSAPPGKIKRKKVSLQPIFRFLERKGELPILGDDPRAPNREKVFSASEITQNNSIEGYLYIILGSEKYDSIAQILQKSYILRLSFWLAVGGLLFVLVTGLFLFRQLTRRLHEMEIALDSFKQSGFTQPFQYPFKSKGRDEIDHFGLMFQEMSQRIITQMDQVRRADKHRRELVTNISHDLRTPLAALQGYLETLLLKEGKSSREERLNHLETALKHSNRLGKLIFELFELSKLDSQEGEISREPFRLGELVQDIAQKFQLQTKSKQIEIETFFPETLPFANADIGLIERVIQNLLDNAIRYTPPDGRIQLILSQVDSNIVVRVIDSGDGIGEKELPYIFDRFYRAKEQEGGNNYGSGLGLAIVKRILELHESSIHVESSKGKGTTFIFKLPSINVGTREQQN